MLLSISTTYQPATDLGYLLHKHPDRYQQFELTYGVGHVFFAEATTEQATAVLMLDIDPVGLVRRRGADALAQQYVNDRPYAASSLLSTAIAQVYGSALHGRCREKPQLAQTPIPLQFVLTGVPDATGGQLLERLFKPLKYDLQIETMPLDATLPEWGASPYVVLTLRHTLPLTEALSHVYVLIPTLDAAKHYWVGAEEIDKLLRHGEGWLAQHPERDFIVQRYLRYLPSLTTQALERIMDGEVVAEDAPSEREPSLHQQRLQQVADTLAAHGGTRVLDLGCGEGKLIQLLLKQPQWRDIVGMDVAHRALEKARERLHLDQLAPAQRERITLLHGSLVYKDQRLAGFDAAAIVEVIEHLDATRLEALEAVVFQHARPATVVVTTPNAEYNVRYATLHENAMRHSDHRFEWSRAEFQAWAQRVASSYGYRVEFASIGTLDDALGAPGQMGVFTR